MKCYESLLLIRKQYTYGILIIKQTTRAKVFNVDNYMEC